MRSIGEAFGADPEFGLAFAKGMMSAGQTLPAHGRVCISVHDRDKAEALELARDFAGLGFTLMAALEGIRLLRDKVLTVRALQDGPARTEARNG